ncbi:hypothetical protein BD769DRAFT_1394388 [Suillus cothurnatus]|nr:hypothetical protein BD769DRAFT_1394388 [Suillus cothurnatus]
MTWIRSCLLPCSPHLLTMKSTPGWSQSQSLLERDDLNPDFRLKDFAWPKLGSIDDLMDNIQGRLEVLLQSKLGAATVTSFNESSPLETASDVTVELNITFISSNKILPGHIVSRSQAMALSLTKNASPKPLQSKSFATCTPASILRELHDSPEGFYAASPRLIRHVEYFIGGRDGNILVSKGGLQAKEFIICGVFEISCNDFNFTPDANFNPSNVFHGRFSDVKLSCQLIAGCNDRFRFSSEDFPDVLDNIAHFKGLIPRERDYEKLSAAKNEDQYDTASDKGDDCSTIRSWGNGEQQQDDGRVGKGLGWVIMPMQQHHLESGSRESMYGGASNKNKRQICTKPFRTYGGRYTAKYRFGPN